MPRKTKIIFITVFILVGAIMLGIYFYNKNKNSTDTAGDSFYEKFNPFGSGKTINTGKETDTPTDNVAEEGTPTPQSKFQKITEFAVAGATFFEDKRDLPIVEPTTPIVEPEPIVTTKIVNGKVVKTTTKPVVEPAPTFEMVPSLKYVERATGHIYQIYIDTKITGKVSNSTIPSVYETIFNGAADSVIYRYLSSEDKSITSFLATLGGKSSFLSSNILEVSVSPDKTRFFSLIKNTNGVIGVTKSFNNSNSVQVFTSSFSEWLPQWVSDKTIFLTTKPSYLVEGNVYSLNTTNGTLTKVFGGVKGLTTLANKEGTSLLYGASLDKGPKLNVLNIKDRMSIDLDAYGLPEKCVWSSDNINIYCAVPNTVVGNQYPDSWYQGLVSFDDFFVKINTLTKESYTIANSKNEIPVDGTNLFLSKDEDKLFFINKKDSTLWSLDL